MSLTREVLSPVTTAAGLYPALHTLISQVANLPENGKANCQIWLRDNYTNSILSMQAIQ